MSSKAVVLKSAKSKILFPHKKVCQTKLLKILSDTLYFIVSGGTGENVGIILLVQRLIQQIIYIDKTIK